jgi:hypothetical protein
MSGEEPAKIALQEARRHGISLSWIWFTPQQRWYRTVRRGRQPWEVEDEALFDVLIATRDKKVEALKRLPRHWVQLYLVTSSSQKAVDTLIKELSFIEEDVARLAEAA